jgi:Ser/Thr protein kinase RdoA (MazF antagonist)
MGRGKVPADWPPITLGEAAVVAGHYPELGGVTAVRWHSRRPMSAAALVDTARGGAVFVKRHHRGVRDGTSLGEEHAFGAYLRAEGVELPRVLPTGDGATFVAMADWVYEVHDLASGVDAYREVPSWEPYRSVGHAASAGGALARFHLAAAGYLGPVRQPSALCSSDSLVRAADPAAALDDLVARRPGLARALARWSWRSQMGEVIAALAAAAPLVARLAPQWGHGDWHPSNLRWSESGPDAVVVGVTDLGLANRTSAVHDLAVALERAVVGWQDLEERGSAPVDLEAVDAVMSGYVAQRALRGDEVTGLIALLPVVHVDYALSEIEYFADVVTSPTNTELAYRGYLLGHAAWFAHDAEAATLLARVQRAATG